MHCPDSVPGKRIIKSYEVLDMAIQNEWRLDMRCVSLFSHRIILAVVFCVTSVFSMNLSGCGKHEKPQGPPPVAEVVVMTVHPRTIPAVFPFVAQIQSSHQVDITARVSGFLEKISYPEGEHVSQGQVLFQIDNKPFKAAVDAARAQVEILQSQLWTAKASYNRIKPLADLNAASKSDLDNATGAVKSAEAGLQQAQANPDKANLDLGYTTITSPVSGVSGQSKIREGGYVAAGTPSASLTYVAKLDPAWVDFSVTQNEQAELRREVANGTVVTPAGHRYTVQNRKRGQATFPHTHASL